MCLLLDLDETVSLFDKVDTGLRKTLAKWRRRAMGVVLTSLILGVHLLNSQLAIYFEHENTSGNVFLSYKYGSSIKKITPTVPDRSHWQAFVSSSSLACPRRVIRPS